MNVLTVINSFFSSCTYLLETREQNLLVDCGDVDKFTDIANFISGVLLTHAHYDHIYGLNNLLKLSPDIKVYTNSHGCDMLADSKKNLSAYHETPFTFNYRDNIVTVDDGDEIVFSKSLTARAIFTPGHNPSCITWMVGNKLFTGDSLIPGIKVVTNLPGGNISQATDSERKIRQILALGNLEICPGH